MSLEADSITINARMKTEWSARQPSIPVLWDNIEDNERPNDAHIRFVIRFGARPRRSFTGDNVRRAQLGRVIVQVFVKAGTGTALAEQLAFEVQNIFADWRAAPEISFGDADVDPIGVRKGSAWHQVNVSIPFESVRYG